MIANDASQSSPRSYLFVLWEGGGNVPPILGLAHRLVERGHRVRVISDPCNEPEARAAGCEFVSYTRAPRRVDKSAESTLVRDYEAKNPLGGLRIVLDKMACGPALEYATDVLEALDRFPADAVIVSELLFGGCFAAEDAGLPCVIPGIYTLPAPGMPPPGMMPASGVVGWVQGKVADIVFGRAFAHGLPALNRARSALGLPTPIDLSAYLRDRLARVLVLTSPAFDFPARLPANVRYVGPVLDDPSGYPRWEPPWPEHDGRALVIVSFSTSYQGHETVLQKAVDALGQTDYRGLVTLGPAIESHRIDSPPNVWVQPFVPHSLVFPQAAAVVTHAGHGTIIRSLAYGVPLVCLPLGRDQPANAARVVYYKLGLRLGPDAEPAEIASAVRRVVGSPVYREHARRMAAQLQEESCQPAAVDELEDVAGSRGVSGEADPDRVAPVSRRTRARNAALP